MSDIKTGRAAEAGHWYALTDDGTPVAAYEVPRAKPGPNGETHRRTTLRDAKKLGLLGSFSTIWKIRANPALDRWKQASAILAALTSPRRAEYEAGTLSEDDFLDSVIADAEAEGRDAADTGTLIHAAIEQALRGEEYDPRWIVHVENALEALATIAPLDEWHAELVFANPALGYGGKIDAESGRALADFKTVKPWKDKPPVYDSWPVQLAAYAAGLGREYGTHRDCRWYNIVISRGEDARVEVVHYSDAERRQAWEEWDATRKLWLITSGMGEVLGVRS